MRRSLSLLLLFCYSLSGHAATPVKPKLVVAIIVDQFRYDYLQRFHADYTAGLKRLIDEGAVFEDAHYIHAATETAPGHSTFLSGATPSVSGIVANEWYDRERKAVVTSVEDRSTLMVGGAPGVVGASPSKLLAATLGDQIRAQGRESRIIGVSFKDRAAVLMAGRAADAAYWWDTNSNHWVTSTFYMKSLPAWVADINRARPIARAIGEAWFPLNAGPSGKPYCTMVADSPAARYCGTLMATPWGNELIEEFAERALVEEKLGRHEGTDLLTISFSSNDAVGHATGPDAPEVRDISIRTDVLLGHLLKAIDQQVGLSNVELVLTADHGVAPMAPVDGVLAEPAKTSGTRGGRLQSAKLGKLVQDGLAAQFGPGDWIESNTGTAMVLRRAVAEKYNLDWVKVEQAAADLARRMPHVARVYTDCDFGQLDYDDEITASMRKSYFAGRSPDLMILPDPYYTFAAAEASHGTPYEYDTHVPVIFFGSGIKPGRYSTRIAPNDIAPTLSDIIGVTVPAGSAGHVLREILQSAR
jgi:predicted AlkP superfamily pyrophosphatase or phosphodiesterase